MAADLGAAPWNRLSKLCPPETDQLAMQEAADRYVSTGDLYMALADLWDEAAVKVSLLPPDAPDPLNWPVSSVSQDGVTVTYANRGAIDYSQDQRLKQEGAYRRIANGFRKRSQVQTPLIIGADESDRYDEDPNEEDDENGIIEIGNW